MRGRPPKHDGLRTLPYGQSSDAALIDEISDGALQHDVVSDPTELTETLCITPFNMQERLNSK
jgi:hypothetical protein